MGKQTAGISPGDINAKWAEVAMLLDVLAKRIDSKNEWPVEKRSSLGGDDRAINPYFVSHAVISCLFTGIQHLHAIKTLVIDARALHTGPPWSLGRAALENLATAYWILNPSSRRERVIRTLRWHYQNLRDQEQAVRPIQPEFDSIEIRKARLSKAASANSIEMSELSAGYRSTTVIKYLDQHFSGKGDLLLLWRIGSGMAHGRPWANLGVSDQEVSPTENDDVVHVRLSDDLSRVLLPVLRGIHVTQEVLRVLDQRRMAQI
ncbi:MAG: hypothetical protein IT192_06865 [Microbacteriaceae bacterium]|nr:hypothetical protein [Microbacteriaceae bacterium]